MSDIIAEQGFCECGCGQRTRIAKWKDASKGWVRGKPLRFALGHTSKTLRRQRFLSTRGYVVLRMPGHPHANTQGEVTEHVAVACAALGRALPKGTEVHHVNGIKTDNRSSNLVICPNRAYHVLLHLRARAQERCGDASARKCVRCGQWSAPNTMANHSKNQFIHETCKRQYANGKQPRKSQ